MAEDPSSIGIDDEVAAVVIAAVPSEAVPPPIAQIVEEKRDDLETVALMDSEFRTTENVSSNFEGETTTMEYDNNGNDDAEGDGEDNEDDDDNDNPMNMTRLDDDEDSRLDIHSVLSGNNNDVDSDDEDDNDMETGSLGKNLGAIFDNAKEMDRHLNLIPSTVAPATTSASATPAMVTHGATKKPASISSGGHPSSRPPLAPARSVVLTSLKTSNDGSGKRVATMTPKNATAGTAGIGKEKENKEDKRLGVFLRVRPPVAGNTSGKSSKAGGSSSVEGCINTIEVIGSDGDEQQPLPTTIRTYPPLNSNAAKVVRGGQTQASLKNALGSSKSLIADTSDDSIVVDPHTEVRGVKEYSYSGVFGPDAMQEEVYDSVAAPLVEGLFPKSHGEELGESALLFTLGVTNAGKTHTVMGTGFETKADKKNKKSKSVPNQSKKKDDASFSAIPNKDWGIIPRSLDHMLTRVNSLNEQATMTSGAAAPQLQMYMSYLEIYNENIFDLLPDNANNVATKRRAFDGPPTLKLRESSRGRIFVRGLARHAVSNVRQGLELAQMAKSNRHTASNNINAESSRSHSICQLEIAHVPPTAAGRAAATGGAEGGSKRNGSVSDRISEEYPDSEYETDDESVCSKSSACSTRRSTRQQQQQASLRKKSTIIWIVDLAGSERSKRTRSTTRHQKEAALINASLMNLMRCLREMLNHQPSKQRGATSKSGGGGVVPFRESKLTHMFMNHLTGPAASRTSIIVNVNPAADDYDETQHILGYAATARSVTISAVDYNRKRRMFAQESSNCIKNKVMKTGKALPREKLANIVKKLSPKKRKGTVESTSSNSRVKRLRSNSPALANISKKPAPRAAAGFLSGGARKPPPTKASSTRAPRNRVPKGGMEELEQLREDKFSLEVTVEDLRKQLADSEAEVRSEVVEMMGEQLEERKTSYENRIAQLQQQITSLQSSKQAQFDHQSNNAEILLECEEEMKRMREDHNAEMEEMSETHLSLVNEHNAAMDKLAKKHKEDLREEKLRSKQLQEEVGALRHRSRELQAGHDSLLAKYNALLLAQQQRNKDAALALEQEKENPATASMLRDMQSPSSIRKLPRERVSNGASAVESGTDVVTSPKRKMRSPWFKRSPGAKVAIGNSPKKEMSPKKLSPVRPPSNTRSPTRSPLGNNNRQASF